MSETSSSRGRPRAAEVERKVEEAALRVISSGGYAGMTVEAVAREAGVSKPTIYLRYGSKEGLATSAMASVRIGEAPSAGEGCRRALVSQLEHLRRSFEEISGMNILGAALAEERQTPALLRMWREKVAKPSRELFLAALARGVERGEISEKADLRAVVDALHGAYFARFISGETFEKDWAENAVDTTLEGIEERNRRERS